MLELGSTSPKLIENFAFRSSSVVEQSAVNRSAAGSNPACGATMVYSTEEMYTLVLVTTIGWSNEHINFKKQVLLVT